jgi:hypothetical protein
MYPESFLNMNPSLISGSSLFVTLSTQNMADTMEASANQHKIGNTGDDGLFRVVIGGHDFACFLCWFQEVSEWRKMYVIAASGRIQYDYKQKIR